MWKIYLATGTHRLRQALILKLPRNKVKTKLYGLSDALVSESKSTIQLDPKPRVLSQNTEKVNAIVSNTLNSAHPDQSFNYNFKVWKTTH